MLMCPCTRTHLHERYLRPSARAPLSPACARARQFLDKLVRFEAVLAAEGHAELAAAARGRVDAGADRAGVLNAWKADRAKRG